MYHTIVAPLDGSKRAERILPHLEELAHHYNARVIFLQVVELHPVALESEGNYMERYQEELERQTKQIDIYLTGLEGEFREKGIKARTRVVQGPVVEAIINAAESEGADLIALASHGRSGLSRVFYGSVTAGVLHRIDRPLLLIRSLDRE